MIINNPEIDCVELYSAIINNNLSIIGSYVDTYGYEVISDIYKLNGDINNYLIFIDDIPIISESISSYNYQSLSHASTSFKVPGCSFTYYVDGKIEFKYVDRLKSIIGNKESKFILPFIDRIQYCYIISCEFNLNSHDIGIELILRS